MQDLSRYIGLTYLVGGLILAWVMAKTLHLVLYQVSPAADQVLFGGLRISLFLGVAVAAGVVWWLNNNERSRSFLAEVVSELSQVTWPNREETQNSTFVVIVFAVIVSIILFCFDFVWKYVTDWILTA